MAAMYAKGPPRDTVVPPAQFQKSWSCVGNPRLLRDVAQALIRAAVGRHYVVDTDAL